MLNTFHRAANCCAGAGAVAALIAMRAYIAGRYQAFRSLEPGYFFNGADQLLLYGPQYRWPLILLLAFGLAVIVNEAMRRRATERMISPLVPAQLYGLVLLAILLLPETIVLPQYAAPAGFLHERLSCICAIFACCLLASLKPAKWRVAGFYAVAACFFFYLYGDTATINRLEDQAERVAQSLPLWNESAGDHPAAGRLTHIYFSHRGSRLHRPLLQLRKLRARIGAVSRARQPRQSYRHHQYERVIRNATRRIQSAAAGLCRSSRFRLAKTIRPSYARANLPPASSTEDRPGRSLPLLSYPRDVASDARLPFTFSVVFACTAGVPW